MSITTVKDKSGLHEVSYDDKPTARYRYKLDGKAVPGATTFTKGGYPTSLGLVNWKIMEGSEYSCNKVFELLEKQKYDEDAQKQIIRESKDAWKISAEEQAGIGTIVHDYAYLSSLKRDEEALEMLSEHEGTPQWDKILNAVYKVDNFNKENKDEILHLETIVGSIAYQFAGRFDRLVLRNGLNILSDYKTSGDFYIDQFIQDGAYAIAIEEWLGIKVDGFEVIRFGKEDGDFESLLITEPNEVEELKKSALRCLDTYNFVKKWAKDKRFK